MAIVAATAATGHTVFDFDAHTPFLAGIGNFDLRSPLYVARDPCMCDLTHSFGIYLFDFDAHCTDFSAGIGNLHLEFPSYVP